MHYGYKYLYSEERVESTAPFPAWLQDVVSRIKVALQNVAQEESCSALNAALLNDEVIAESTSNTFLCVSNAQFVCTSNAPFVCT